MYAAGGEKNVDASHVAYIGDSTTGHYRRKITANTPGAPTPVLGRTQ